MRKRIISLSVLAAVAAFSLFSALSCGDLLSRPPASVTVTLAADPAVDPDVGTASLTWTTSAACTNVVEYGTSAGTYVLATPRSDPASSAHAVTLAGLQSNTTYYYRIVSWTSSNRSFPSAEFRFTTDPNPTTDILISGYSATPALTSIALNWTTNFPAYHLVEYGTSTGTYAYSTLLSGALATSHAVTLPGLTPTTTYYFRIRCTRDAGPDFVSGEYVSTTTTEASPTAAQKARGIWILGGLSGPAIGSTVATVELFDPVTNNWITPSVTSIPSTGGNAPVSFAAYAAADGKLFVIGGFDSTGVVRDLVQIYTISTGTWSTGTAMPAPRANICAAVSNGKIYIMGGTTANAAVAWAGSVTNYEYSISGNSWNTRLAYAAANNSERFSYAYSDVIYNIAGRNAAATVAASAHDAYVFASNALSTGVTETAMATNRSGVVGALYLPVSGPPVVMMVGGVSTFTGATGCFVNQGTTTPTLSNLQQYLAFPFAAPSAWTIPTAGSTTYPSLIAFGAATISTAVSPARFYYFGGVTALGTTTTIVSSNYSCIVPTHPTWNGTWDSIPNMSAIRWGHGAVTLNQ
jgi:hypothetical protein